MSSGHVREASTAMIASLQISLRIFSSFNLYFEACVICSNSNPNRDCIFLDQTKSRERGRERENELEMQTVHQKQGNKKQ